MNRIVLIVFSLIFCNSAVANQSNFRSPQEICPDAEKTAFSILATLEGAMILARTLDDTAAFDAAAQMLTLE